MLGPKQEAQSALFYDFSIENYIPTGHILRAIDGIIDLSGVRQHLSGFYSTTGHPSVDPELMIPLPGRRLHSNLPRGVVFVTARCFTTCLKPLLHNASIQD